MDIIKTHSNMDSDRVDSEYLVVESHAEINILHRIQNLQNPYECSYTFADLLKIYQT